MKNDSPEETFLAVLPTEKAWLADFEDTDGNALAPISEPRLRLRLVVRTTWLRINPFEKEKDQGLHGSGIVKTFAVCSHAAVSQPSTRPTLLPQ